MDEQLLKQLVRQMKILNIWVSLFGTLFIVALIVVGVLLYQLITFLGETNRKIESVKTDVSSSVDVQGQACSSDNALGTFLRDSTDVCN